MLAARDASGSVPLRQARSSQDSLIISTCAQLPEGSHDAEDISAGSFKYGWHASPRPFTPNKPLGDMHPTCHRQQPVSLPSSKATSPRSPTVRQGLVAELDAAQQHLAAMVSPLAPVPEHAGRGKGRPGMQQEERRHSMEERTRGRRSMDARRSSIEQPRRHSIDSHKVGGDLLRSCACDVCTGNWHSTWKPAVSMCRCACGPAAVCVHVLLMQLDASRSSDHLPLCPLCQVQQEHAGHGRRSLDLQPGRADAHNSWTRKEQPASAQKGGQRTRSSRQQAGSNSHKKPAQPGMPDSWHVVHHHHGHAGSQQQGRSVTPKAAAAQASKAKAMADGNMFDALGSETESICSRASSRSSSDSLRSHGSGASRGSRRSHGSSKGSPAASPITEAAAAAAASAAVAGLAPASSGPSPKPPRTRSGSSAADSEAAAGNMARLMANLLGPSMPAAPQPAAVAPLELWSASAAPEPVVPAGGATLKETRWVCCRCAVTCSSGCCCCCCVLLFS